MLKRNALPFLLLVAGLALISYAVFGKGASGLSVKIKPATYIMPAAYKVYSNPEVLGGRFNLFKAILKNNGTKTIHNLKVEYRIPKYIDSWTEAPAGRYLLPGQTAVVTGYPSFDQKITEKNSQSKEKAEIRITYGSKANPEEVDESFTFTMMAANDFAYTDMPASEIVSFRDLTQNDALSACFITAEDPVVKYYSQKIQEKILKGETAGVEKKAEEAVRFLMGIYDATLRSRMVYSSTQCVPSNTGDINTTVQRIRLPREVISGNTGLCIELSFLYASILRNAGLEPLVFFIPGHAYPGIRFNGQIYAIESTAIGGEGLGGSRSAQEAFKKGMEQVQEFFQHASAGDERYNLVDVNYCYKQGVIPMELKDDVFSKQKIDEISQRWDGARGQNFPTNGGQANVDQGRPRPRPGNVGGMASYNSGVSFSYPRGWRLVNSPYPQFPFLTAAVMAPDMANIVEVYNFGGYTNLGGALNYLQQTLAAYGLRVNYRQIGQQNGYVTLAGTTYGPQVITWVGAFRVRNNSVEGIVAGSSTGNIGLAQQIVATVR